jgi:hypothetical protein
MTKRIKRPWIWRDRPEGVVDVTRATRFGNPFTEGDDRTTLVARYRQWVTDPDAPPIRGKRRTFRPPTGANEPWATCPRVISQKTPSSKASIRSQTLGEQDGNRRFRLLNCPVDRPAGLFRDAITGTRPKRHAVRIKDGCPQPAPRHPGTPTSRRCPRLELPSARHSETCSS